LMLCVAALTNGQSFRLKISNTNTQALVLSAGVAVDQDRRKFSVYMDVKNAGLKPIQGFKWEYETNDGGNGDFLRTVTSGTTLCPKPLQPNKHQKFSLLNDQTVKPNELDEWSRRVTIRNGSVRITGLQSTDGSQWIAPADN
jgi:hypothetical protein